MLILTLLRSCRCSAESAASRRLGIARTVGNNLSKFDLMPSKTDFIYLIGIGGFSLLWILNISELTEHLTESLLSILKLSSIFVLWLPKLIGLFIFTLLILWLKRKFSISDNFNLRKKLIQSIFIFFGVLLIQFLFSFFESSFLVTKFPDGYVNFLELKKRNLELLGIIEFSSLLKYFLFGLIILIKR